MKTEPTNSTSVPAPSTAPKARRRFTPEEKIANAKAEIAKAEEQQRQKVLEMVTEAMETLRQAHKAAEKATGMADEAKTIAAALHALVRKPEVEAN